VFSLDPIPGYDPPLLAGHKDAIVSVFFTGPGTRRAASLAGATLPVLCTLSRDGALFTWGFTPAAPGRLPASASGTTVVQRGIVPGLAPDGGGGAKKRKLVDARAGRAAAQAARGAQAAAAGVGRVQPAQRSPTGAGGSRALVNGPELVPQEGADDLQTADREMEGVDLDAEADDNPASMPYLAGKP
jgi:hypothetical protein